VQQFSRLSLTPAKKSIQYGGQAVSLTFLAPQNPSVIFALFYSSPKRRGMTDARFLSKIYGPFIYLTAAMVCHSLRCWPTGIFIDKVVFTRSNAGGRINRADLWFSEVSGSVLAKASGYSQKPQVLEPGDK